MERGPMQEIHGANFATDTGATGLHLYHDCEFYENTRAARSTCFSIKSSVWRLSVILQLRYTKINNTDPFILRLSN